MECGVGTESYSV